MSVLALIWSWHRKFLKTFWFLTLITDHKDVVGCLEKQTNDSANWHLQPKGSADFASGYIFVITFKRRWYSSLPLGLEQSQLKTKINFRQTSRDATKWWMKTRAKCTNGAGRPHAGQCGCQSVYCTITAPGTLPRPSPNLSALLFHNSGAQ